jgi:hypothetical protein
MQTISNIANPSIYINNSNLKNGHTVNKNLLIRLAMAWLLSPWQNRTNKTTNKCIYLVIGQTTCRK